MKKLIKQIINALLHPLGLEMRRKADRESMEGALQHIRSLGFQPATVIDVGAADGTPALYATFPQSVHFLIEPLVEFRPQLEKWKQRYPRLDYLIAAASSQAGEVTFHVHPDLVGSSLLREGDDIETNGAPRRVPAVRLDDLAQQYKLQPPFLLKLDVQGAELEVLAGGEQTLAQAEYVILETVLFRFFENGAIFDEVIHYMKTRGFSVYEIFEPGFRLLDGAMSQVDLAFVKTDGRFRQSQAYATPEQRLHQNRQLLG
ncbi:MAG TPA: FkbM family methyltransferase [Anaerolineaceae bacterium]